MSTSPRNLAVKRDWGHDESWCTILHIDMDAFYASCEIARHPELKGKPVIIGTGNRSVVSAASYEARTFGINSAMAVATARRKCPQGIFLPVDMAYYRDISRQIFSLVATVTDQIEQVSVDEAYMDVSAALLQWKSPTAIARWIRENVRKRFSVTCSVGIAANKLVAKLASTNAKPDGLLLVPRNQHAAFVRLLPLRAIPGVGPAVEERFRKWGITTVDQLAQIPVDTIARITGSLPHAHSLYRAARGQHDGVVTPHSPEKSIGAERTFPKDTTNVEEVLGLVRHCSDDVAATVRRRGLVARTVTVKVRFEDLTYMTKARTLESPTDSTTVIVSAARHLFFAMLKIDPDATTLPRPLRLAGVSTSSLGQAATTALQPTLDLLDPSSNNDESANDPEKMRKAEKTLDSIRSRYGSAAIRLGLQ